MAEWMRAGGAASCFSLFTFHRLARSVTGEPMHAAMVELVGNNAKYLVSLSSLVCVCNKRVYVAPDKRLRSA